MLETEDKTYDALALFSGGLDSILAVKVLEAQGLKVKTLHFFTPFFGKPEAKRYWAKIYGLDLSVIDVGEDFVRLLKVGPDSGFGKVLNPCVDCKILLLRHAKTLLARYGATFLATGEVMGQRPMSQRRDTLNRISREADVRDCLLRPLSALHLPPTPMEEDGRVKRELLCGISGRGRTDQFELAARFGITEIPTPAGGCRLAEMENARRYWPILKYFPDCSTADFYLANLGRQLWAGRHWMTVGRNIADNQALEKLIRPDDFVFKTLDFPGPLSVGRPVPGAAWDEAALLSAATLSASFSPKAKQHDGPVRVRITQGETSREVLVTLFADAAPHIAGEAASERAPEAAPWQTLTWADVKPEIHALRKQPARPARAEQEHASGNTTAEDAAEDVADVADNAADNAGETTLPQDQA